MSVGSERESKGGIEGPAGTAFAVPLFWMLRIAVPHFVLAKFVVSERRLLLFNFAPKLHQK